MARAVYSTQFLAASTNDSQSFDYTVPDGYVAVVRDLQVRLDEQSSGACYVYITPSDATILQVTSGSEGGAQKQWSGGVVLNAGDVLVALFSTSAFASVVASGYLLSA